MTRRYDDPVEVRRRDEDPAEFLWRGRFYAVREVLAHWVETGAWWQRRARPDGSSALAARPVRARRRAGGVAGRGQPRAGRHGPGSTTCASTGRAGGWTLLRAQD